MKELSFGIEAGKFPENCAIVAITLREVQVEVDFARRVYFELYQLS
jgi:hypothetical protein